MTYITKNERETESIGENFAKSLKPGCIVALRGEMGAGKTVFVRGVARGLGISGRVTSPTYTVVNEYNGEMPLFHFDLYRLGSADELFEIGFDDYLSRGGVCLIEWFEKAEDEYAPDIVVDIVYGEEEDTRSINIREI
ncbi:MAG: tRNA (adenosine(37)-N6)-threonylcarbamoyltransferase complex ATPase subunit type 1 TsaE [Oscillospiraceae bacterium]|nr:tRNA (adenosine(37)-N6)-threonylcarbamoyltransferase complex ATPase subunit type 1 TsaE [Oscillospiraceae bacterium]